jgi:hypothetical protein
MAYKSGKDVHAILFDELDVKASNSEIGITCESIIPRKRPLGSVYPKNFVTGQHDAGMTIKGWFDPDTEPALGEITGTNKVVSLLHEGNAVADRFYGFAAAKVGGRGLGVQDDDLDSYEPTIVVDGPLSFGYVVGPLAARTTAGNTDATYVDLGAASADGGRAFQHTTALTLGGYTSAALKVRHSTDHTTFTDKATFTDVAAVGAESVEIAGPLNQYVSMSWAWTGAGADQSITSFVGVGVD